MTCVIEVSTSKSDRILDKGGGGGGYFFQVPSMDPILYRIIIIDCTAIACVIRYISSLYLPLHFVV